MQKVFDVKAIAERYAVALSTARQWIESGELPATNVSGPKAKRCRWRCSEDDLQQFEKRRGSVQPVAAAASRKNARTVTRPTKDYLQGGVQ